MSPFDRVLFRRALAAIVGTLGVAALVVVATDEATSTPGMRVARLSALAPLLVAVSVLGVAGHARSRGELAALAALGLSPWRAARGAACAGLFAAAVVLAALVSPWADTSSLFPVVHPPLDWAVDALGSAARASGAVVLADGSITLAAVIPGATSVAPGALAALACVAPLALVVPYWAVTPMSPRTRVGSLAATGALAIGAFHLVAAARVLPAWSACAVLPLVAVTALSRSSG